MPFPRHTLAEADALVAAAGFHSTTVDAAERCVDCRRLTRRKIVDGVFYCPAPTHVRRAIEVARRVEQITRERVAEVEAIDDADEPATAEHTATEWVVYCPTHRHYLVFASEGGTTWTDEQDNARRYGKREAGKAAEVATWLDHKPTPWALPVVTPAPAAPVHYTREQIAARFAEVDEFVLVLGPDDRAYDPETGDTLLGGVTVRYARGEFPRCPYTATIVDEEQRQADTDTATGTDADRVTIHARASELRPGDLIVDVLGTRQYAAFDVQAAGSSAPHVKVWTAVADQERGLPPVLILNAGRELLVSRRLTPEQQIEARELFGDAPERPAHVPASVPDTEVDQYLDAYPFPGA